MMTITVKWHLTPIEENSIQETMANIKCTNCSQYRAACAACVSCVSGMKNCNFVCLNIRMRPLAVNMICCRRLNKIRIFVRRWSLAQIENTPVMHQMNIKNN